MSTERHESRRNDNQLRGLSGRQGDAGESSVDLARTDAPRRLFNSEGAAAVMNRAGVPDDTPLESKVVSRAIQSAQSQVEARNFEIRKNVLEYDDVLSRQRTVIYDERRRVLEGEDLASQVQHFLRDVIAVHVDAVAIEARPEDWDLKQLWNELATVFPVSITVDERSEER